MELFVSFAKRIFEFCKTNINIGRNKNSISKKGELLEFRKKNL